MDFDFRPDDWSGEDKGDEFLFSLDVSGQLDQPANPDGNSTRLEYRGTVINTELNYWGGNENNPAVNSAYGSVIVPGATWAGGSVRTNYNDWQDESGATWFWWSVNFRGRALNGPIVGGGGGGGGKGIAPRFSEATVPEPTTLALLAASPILSFWRRRAA